MKNGNIQPLWSLLLCMGEMSRLHHRQQQVQANQIFWKWEKLKLARTKQSPLWHVAPHQTHPHLSLPFYKHHRILTRIWHLRLFPTLHPHQHLPRNTGMEVATSMPPILSIKTLWYPHRIHLNRHTKDICHPIIWIIMERTVYIHPSRSQEIHATSSPLHLTNSLCQRHPWSAVNNTLCHRWDQRTYQLRLITGKKMWDPCWDWCTAVRIATSNPVTIWILIIMCNQITILWIKRILLNHIPKQSTSTMLV